jgi:hypothetical protein
MFTFLSRQCDFLNHTLNAEPAWAMICRAHHGRRKIVFPLRSVMVRAVALLIAASLIDLSVGAERIGRNRVCENSICKLSPAGTAELSPGLRSHGPASGGCSCGESSKRRFLLHEFVIMPNHFHLLLTPAAEIPLENAPSRAVSPIARNGKFILPLK